MGIGAPKGGLSVLHGAHPILTGGIKTKLVWFQCYPRSTYLHPAKFLGKRERSAPTPPTQKKHIHKMNPFDDGKGVN
jgi:hypothetical protein